MTQKLRDSSRNTANSHSVKKLFQTWEGRLAREGLPAELELMTDHVRRPFWISGSRKKWWNMFDEQEKTVMDDVTDSIFATPQAEYWRKITHAANGLPKNFKDREFILAYAELGDANAAAVSCGLNRAKKTAALRRFAKYCLAKIGNTG